MENETILKLIDADDDVKEWLIDADAKGWCDLDFIIENSIRVHGKLSGLHHCDHCGDCVVDVSISPDDDSTAMPVGDDYLCPDCYSAAKKARQKIVVTIDEDGHYDEDYSELNDEESSLASYLDRLDEHESRMEWDIAASYPRGERGQVMRYARMDANDRRLAGKTIVREAE